MKKTYSAKTKEEVITKALRELNMSESEVIYEVKHEDIGLFKGKQYVLNIIIIEDFVKDLKAKIMYITDLMGINVTFEFKKRDNKFIFNLYSDDSNILIGKNGKNLLALETVLKAYTQTNYGMKVDIFVDGLNYRLDRESELKKLAQKMYEEVTKTKVLIKLSDLNSSERKIVHEYLSLLDNVTSYTEDNNDLIIKYKSK